MQLSSDETRALAFIGALIGLTLLGRWVDRPRVVGLDQPEVDVEAVAARSEALLRGRGRDGEEGRGAGARSPGRPLPRGGDGGRAGDRAGAGAGVALNTATVAELERLPGIGPALAGRIVAYRDSVRGFSSIEELDSVKGIGPAMLARLKPLVRLQE